MLVDFFAYADLHKYRRLGDFNLPTNFKNGSALCGILKETFTRGKGVGVVVGDPPDRYRLTTMQGGVYTVDLSSIEKIRRMYFPSMEVLDVNVITGVGKEVKAKVMGFPKGDEARIAEKFTRILLGSRTFEMSIPAQFRNKSKEEFNRLVLMGTCSLLYEDNKGRLVDVLKEESDRIEGMDIFKEKVDNMLLSYL